MSTATRTTIETVEAQAHELPTDAPESDGTLEWDSTTIVVVQARAGGEIGLGYTYTDAAAAQLVEGKLAEAVHGRDLLDVEGAWRAMSAALRNVGRPGLGFMALSAVDIALWDLKARLIGVSLLDLLDAPHDEVPIYGSGGFCSYSDERLCTQLGDWVDQGIPRVKLKVGREPARDRERVAAARAAIGDAELFVDANGAYSRDEAVEWAGIYAAEFGVTWFEEPVSSDDLTGLGLVRDRAPDGIEIAAGEYGDLLPYFDRMAPVVDCLQVDAQGAANPALPIMALADRCADLLRSKRL